MSKDETTAAPMESLPCGCRFGKKDKAFVFAPCSPTCDNYAYIVERTRKDQKPIATLDFRGPGGQLPFMAICPYCGQKNDRYTSDDYRAKPKPGDRSICSNCTRIGVFTEHGIRKPTPEEEAAHKDSIDVEAMRRAARLLWENTP